jgi:hypothetical protein
MGSKIGIGEWAGKFAREGCVGHALIFGVVVMPNLC